MNALPPLPQAFWLLISLCLVGFLLCVWLLRGTGRDTGRNARRRALRQRIATLAIDDGSALDSMQQAVAQVQQQQQQQCRAQHPGAPLPWFLFLGDATANLPGLLAAATARGKRSAASFQAPTRPPGFWRWWLTGAMTAIEIEPAAVNAASHTAHGQGLWLQALLALAERRDRLPLQGLVACVGATALLPAPADGAEAIAATPDRTATGLRYLIDEAAGSLRLQLPVYLVVTGLEQLPGYPALRGLLPPEVLAQVLGHRLPILQQAGSSHATASDCLDALFDPIVQRLHALRMGLLCEQPQAAGRLAVHEFVEAVRALQPALRRTAAALFDTDHEARAPRWRGLYFTAAASGTDEGATEGAPEGAFVADLFERFLPADQPLARPWRV
jgi:type VI protein secretion system component VasK